MVCHNCSGEFPANAERCPHCNIKIKAGSAAEITRESKISRTLVLKNIASGKKYPVVPGTLRLGRAEPGSRCEISISDAKVSENHAVLEIGGDGKVAIADGPSVNDSGRASTNGTYINGSPLRLDPDERVRLAPGDRFRIGGTEFTLDYE